MDTEKLGKGIGQTVGEVVLGTANTVVKLVKGFNGAIAESYEGQTELKEVVNGVGKVVTDIGHEAGKLVDNAVKQARKTVEDFQANLKVAEGLKKEAASTKDASAE